MKGRSLPIDDGWDNRDGLWAMSETQRLLQLLGTDKTADEQRICEAAFYAILRGEAIDRAGLWTASDLAREKVDALIDGLIERGLVVVEPGSGRVVGSWGLSLVPTCHQLRIRERELYGWCAVDALGIPAGLGEDAVIISRCSQCDTPVNVKIVAGQISRVEPTDVQVWATASQVEGRSVAGFT